MNLSRGIYTSLQFWVILLVSIHQLQVGMIILIIIQTGYNHDSCFWTLYVGDVINVTLEARMD